MKAELRFAQCRVLMLCGIGHGKLILVTSGPPDPDFLAQTWVLDKRDWQRLHPMHSPLAQVFTGPAYDSVSGRLIVQQSHGPHIV